MSRNVILLFGGESQERLVSVATAQNLSKYLPSALCWFWSPDGHVFEVTHQNLQDHKNAFSVEFVPAIDSRFENLESALDSSVAKKSTFFLGLHGGRGEDGTVQSWLEARGIPFTGSGAAASRDAFDKIRTKEIVAQSGVNIVESVQVIGGSESAESQLLAMLKKHGKIVVKPVCDGSSVGLCILEDQNGISRVLDLLNSHLGRPYVVEPFVSGIELTVGVFEDENGLLALPCTEIRAQKGRVFDYQGKYLGEGVAEITPALVDEGVSLIAQEIAKTAHRALKLDGYSRTDLIISESGIPVFLETNTLPGLTKASLIPQQLSAANIEMTYFVERLLLLANEKK